jgi:hypothetical protein
MKLDRAAEVVALQGLEAKEALGAAEPLSPAPFRRYPGRSGFMGDAMKKLWVKSLGLVMAGLVGGACSAGGGSGERVAETGGFAAAGRGSGGTGNAQAGAGGSTQSGGSATGGTGTAGGATGGSPVGGAAGVAGTTTGGSATGGGSTGGSIGTGGGTTTTGGTATGGGSTTGGSATGGGTTTTGGVATGGTANTGGGATGGAATGGAGTGGSSACAAATITKVSSSDYQLKVCNLTLDVNPQVGARVTKLTLTPSGSSTPTNILQPYACTGAYNGNDSCNSSGITFWTSPQSAWPGGSWPPVAAIDGNAYTVTDEGGTSGHLVLTGTADSTQGVTVTKDFSADGATGWITATYTMKASKAIQVAPWQIARVPRGGLVFFPCTTTAITSPNTTWTMTQGSSYDWIDDKNQTSVSSSDGSKYVVDGAAVQGQTYTLLGYALNGNLLLFKFPNVAQGSFATTNEADIEVYPGSGYIELEAQGAYTSLAANGTSTWTIQWRVVPIDSGVTVGANSSSLITFAQQQAAQ